jgi:dolichol kinase
LDVTSVSRETISWKRKIFHVLGIGCVGATYGFSTATWWQALTVLSVIALIFISLDSLRFFFPKLNKRVRRDFGPYMRNYELERLSGSSWFLASGVLTIALFPKEAASLAFLYLALGDPLASWVGVRWGRIRLPGGKSLEGSLTLFGTCFVAGTLAIHGMIALGVAGSLAGAGLPLIVGVAALSALFAAFGEWLPLRGVDDNFSVPLVTAGLTTLALSALL